MKSAIRMAVVVMMAGASTAALATSGDARGGYDLESSQGVIGDVTETKFEMATTNPDQDMGHGSGEPGAMETMTKVDDAAAEKAALAEYNRRNFLSQVWTTP